MGTGAGAAAAAAAMDTCSSSASSITSGDLGPSSHSFQCCVCLDLLYKPIVLACGHISCFWCMHKAMHGLHPSRCAICRQRYNHFPSICQLLHLLLLKMEPATYRSREKEVLEEEKIRNCFSPQFVDHLISEKFNAEEHNSVAIEDIEDSTENLKSNRKIALDGLPDNRLRNKICEQISVADVQCASCKELLFRPSVLNCGHVYCESCTSGLVNGPLKCLVCQSLHPGDFPKVCWELDHFLEERFPNEYANRREKVQLKKLRCQHGELSLSALETQKHTAKSSGHAEDDTYALNEDLSKAHVGVGCDSCGAYPIIGKRYKCKDCKEKVGFDLCEVCYNTSSKLPGRFNQRHTADHIFELNDSRMVCKLIMLEALLSEEPSHDVPDEGDAEVPENL